MIDFEKQFGNPKSCVVINNKEAQVAATFKLAYCWMTVGLAITGVVAYLTAASGLSKNVIHGPGFWVCAIAEILLVLGLSSSIQKISVAVASLLFLAYSVLNGLTLSMIFHAYELGSIGRVFLITAGMFGGLATWGTLTKSDLSGVGSICGMALWGVIIACIVNCFFRSTGFDNVLSFVSVIIFTGLTAYDAQKIKELANSEEKVDGQTVQKFGILGALMLYLDFINLFLHILRLLGKRR